MQLVNHNDGSVHHVSNLKDAPAIARQVNEQHAKRGFPENYTVTDGENVVMRNGEIYESANSKQK